MCSSHATEDILNKLLSLVTAGSKTWRSVKRVSFSTNVFRYSELLLKSVFGGDVVYGRRDHRECVLFNYCCRETYGLVHGALALNKRGIHTIFRFFSSGL